MLSLEDRLDLLAMPGRYGNAIDDRDWRVLREIFAPDAIFDVRPMQVRMEGVEEIIAFMDGTSAHPLGHLMTNIDIEQRGNGVFVRFRVIFPVANADGSKGPYRIQFGCYYDEVIRTAAGWRVKSRTFTRAPQNMQPTATDLDARHGLAELFLAEKQIGPSHRAGAGA